MLNDMFQRQARRLESQLYQRAQDQRTIEVAQRQAQIAMAKVFLKAHANTQHATYCCLVVGGSKALKPAGLCAQWFGKSVGWCAVLCNRYQSSFSLGKPLPQAPLLASLFLSSTIPLWVGGGTCPQFIRSGLLFHLSHILRHISMVLKGSPGRVLMYAPHGTWCTGEATRAASPRAGRTDAAWDSVTSKVTGADPGGAVRARARIGNM